MGFTAAISQFCPQKAAIVDLPGELQLITLALAMRAAGKTTGEIFYHPRPGNAA